MPKSVTANTAEWIALFRDAPDAKALRESLGIQETNLFTLSEVELFGAIDKAIGLGGLSPRVALSAGDSPVEENRNGNLAIAYVNLGGAVGHAQPTQAASATPTTSWIKLIFPWVQNGLVTRYGDELLTAMPVHPDDVPTP